MTLTNILVEEALHVERFVEVKMNMSHFLCFLDSKE